jgi:hypothetical protein
VQIVIKGVDDMHERILKKRKEKERQKLSVMSSKLIHTPMAVLKAKRAFKRDMVSKNLTIRAQLVSS